MSEVQAAFAKKSAEPVAWFYVDPSTAQTAGPVDAYELAGLLDTSVLTPDALVWADGQDGWKALKDQAALYSQVYQISAAGASKPPALQPESRPTTSAARPGAVTAAAPTPSAAAPADRQLAEFQAEMAALGEDVGTAADVADGFEDGDRAETPPPEDQQFEDDDGTVYVWDRKLRKFQPKHAAAADAARPDYDLEEMTFEAEEETIPAFVPPVEEAGSEDDVDMEKLAATMDESGKLDPPEASAEQPEPPQPESVAHQKGKGKAKRRPEDVMERIKDKQKKAKIQEDAQKQWFDLKVNTSVYVTGLPDDISEAQLAERFAAFGVIKPDEDGVPKVKLYRDKATGAAKGDGLVTFLYEPSIDLACKLADGDFFRPGMAKRMTVQLAKFEMHGTEYVPKKKGKKKSSKDRAKLAEKVLGWGGFDDKLKPTQVTVILENLFHPDDFEEEPTLLKDLGSDIKEECNRLGPVDKVRIFPGNPAGAASVKFKSVEAAEECVRKMQGRFFGGRQVKAGLWDGFTNYNIKAEETPEQQAARLERFAREIEAQKAELEAQKAKEDALAANDA